MNTIDLDTIASGLERSPEGIWFSKRQAHISYPEEGNLNCLALEADSFWFEHRSRCILAALERFPAPGVMFDIGGGNGYVAAYLRQAGVASALVEPGLQGARFALQRGVAPVICSTLEDAGFKPDTLPAVGLFDVLEHIADEAAFLNSIHTLLQPGGRLYLTVPAYPVLWSADDDYAGHHRRYTLPQLKRVIRSAGLHLEFATYFFFMLPLPIFLMRAIPSRLGLRKQNAWDKYQQEHSRQSGLVGKVLNALLSVELAQLRRGSVVPVGGSCLVVARKSL